MGLTSPHVLVRGPEVRALAGPAPSRQHAPRQPLHDPTVETTARQCGVVVGHAVEAWLGKGEAQLQCFAHGCHLRLRQSSPWGAEEASLADRLDLLALNVGVDFETICL